MSGLGLHPERFDKLGEPYYSRVSEEMKKLLREIEEIPKDAGGFGEFCSKLEMGVMDGIDTSRASPIEIVKMTLVLSQVLLETISAQVGDSYAHFVMDPRFDMVLSEMRVFIQKFFGNDFFSSYLTEVLATHAWRVWNTWGRKIYRVSPALQWQLENTKLRDFPVEGLNLPFPCIYLELSPSYRVYNEITGWHTAEGVYILEDDKLIPRVWRIILIGKPNENSPDEKDDAVYHVTIVLKGGDTVEESLEKSFQAVVRQGRSTEEGEFRSVSTKDGIKTISTKLPDYVKVDLEAYNLMKNEILGVFRYVVNVMLYATMSDADSVFCEGSPEYKSLRDRALKAKGQKRDKLLSRARKVGSRPRILLGGSIVIDRNKGAGSKGENEGEKRVQRVRSLVSGHWHRYWVGEGRSELQKKWLRPYFRGPQGAPMSERSYKLVHTGMENA